MGTCREGSLQLLKGSLCLAECQPGLICKVTDVLGTGKCWRTELVSLSQICLWSWATRVSLEHQWLTAAVALALVFKDDCATLHLGKKKCHPPPGSWKPKFWLTDPILLDLLHPLQLICGTSDSLRPIFPRLSVTTPCWAFRCCQPPCLGVSGFPGSSSTRAA